MKNPIASMGSAAWVLGGFASAAALVWLNRSIRSRRADLPLVTEAEPPVSGESWSPDWVYHATPNDRAVEDAPADSSDTLMSPGDLLEIDSEIYEEMNPTPSARYERLYLMDHLGPEDDEDASESDNLGSAWLLRATQGSAPREQVSSVFDGSETIDLQASPLEGAESAPHTGRSRA